jgi:UDP-N-acetylmuramyl pentapeptide synthase
MLDGLAAPELSGMRQNIQQAGGLILIDDTYNASPASMRAALELLRGLPGGRRIAVLGDMLELGEIAAAEHEWLGEMVAEAGAAVLVTVGDKTRLSGQTAAERGVKHWHFADSLSPAGLLRELLRPGDVVLFKGSRGMKMDELFAAVKEYLTGQGQTGHD